MISTFSVTWYLRPGSLVQSMVCEIGVQLIYNEGEEIDSYIAVQASPVAVNAEILGFDVATPSPIVGLATIKRTLISSALNGALGLNEYGLLESVDHALRFREMTNKRVLEHAPFYVYKLFRVEPAV